MKAIPSIPSATYRLQFHHGFCFADALAIVPYLHELGISHVYASPIFKAGPGSLHGYDIYDHNQVNPELGTREEFIALARALQDHGMGMILDFVPNHMGIAEPDNDWWMDVLENGPSSPFANFFDIDWKPLKRELENRVLLPILGDQYGRVLENGQFHLHYADGAFHLHYFESRLPVAPRTAKPVLERALARLRGTIPDDAIIELESILTAIKHLPSRFDRSPENITERAREGQVIKRRLNTLCIETAEVQATIESVVSEINDSHNYNDLDALIMGQCYRLSYWRVAGEEINYRRFFDINTLAAIRMELPEVFKAAHAMVFDLLREGAICGLRIDHVDGLCDPSEYLRQLQNRAAAILGKDPAERPLYIAVEKILAPGERLPEDWQVHGTTGYEFASQVLNVLIDQDAERALTDTYQRFTEKNPRFRDVVYRSKLLVMRSAMAGEINVLGSMLSRLSETNRWYRDFTLNALTTAIREVIACFPVYRTYLRPDTPASDDDKRVIERALAAARRRNPALERTVFEFLRQVLLPDPENEHPVDEKERRRFVMKFQQCSGPVAAKGVEDTAYYIYNRLVALNEVGGEPGTFGTSPETFHVQNQARLMELPHCMLTTSTHDTKRSQDVRARIAALSEMPYEWGQAVRRWHIANLKFQKQVDGEIAPDRNEEYLLYQTLLGSWPLEPMNEEQHAVYVSRLQAYMEKAVREAKVNSSWIEPNHSWDDAVRVFVGEILQLQRKRFLRSIESMASRVAELGMVNALSQSVLKFTVPGAPDIYQGNETWDFSLVDPDNRRPVDYQNRQTMLQSVSRSVDPAGLLRRWKNGRIKLFTIHRLLQLRHDRPDLFDQVSYTPLSARGLHGASVIAFFREKSGRRLVVVAPRLSSRVGFPPIGARWGDTWIDAPGPLINIFTGERLEGPTLRLSAAFRELPFAVFTST